MNKHQSWISLIVLSVLSVIAALVFAGGSATRAAAQGSAPMTEMNYKTFLPSVIGSGNSGPVTPTPTPKPPTPPPPPATNPRGFFALTDWLTYNADTAVDANGVHLVFYLSDEKHQDDKRGQPAYYTHCAGSVAVCADPGKWSSLVQFSSGVNEVQVVATADGRPRVLVRRNGSRAYEYEYYECNEQCAEGQNWNGLRVTEAAGVELFNADMPQHGFALDSQGRPRFVYSNSWGIGKPTAIYYTFCDAADCTEPGSWQEVNIHGPIDGKTVTGDYATLVFDGDKPRAVSRLNLSGLPEGVYYYACDDRCQFSVNWGYKKLHHPEGKMWANWDLALDSAGQPRVALYEPAPIDITVGGKLFYAWCDAECVNDFSVRFQMVQVAGGEGRNVDLAIDPQGRTHMVYDAGQRGVLGELWCDANCTDPGQWQRRILETNEQLMAEFAPASPFTCDQLERAWLDAIPSVSFDGAGKLVVAYDVKNVAVCYYKDPTDPTKPPQSRVERLWWAVRWVFFDRS